MYLRRLTISNVRAIDHFDLRFADDETAGWHVILGANGAGKSSVIRSLALALAGPREAAALRQDWTTWQRNNAEAAHISMVVEPGDEDVFTGTGRRINQVSIALEFRAIETAHIGQRLELAAASGQKLAERTIWGVNSGWFAASFGPFRRFTGGDLAYDRLFLSNPRLAPHLTAFGEDVALTEGLRWLRELRVKELEREGSVPLLSGLIEFLNRSSLLPHGARISEVRSEEVVLIDGAGARITVEQMSDGYRSVLSMIFEILRQMTKSYGESLVELSMRIGRDQLHLPGIVAIDEVDAHLHPSWQKDIGPWFTGCFPQLQFVVTTHSPIICRNATTVWRLAEPGSEEQSSRIDGTALQRLIHGSILDAYGTEFFGRDVARSEESKELLAELGRLNRKAMRGNLEVVERKRMEELRAMLPTKAAEAEA